jgi:transcriptional regulator GlxA family with amidase domain
MNDLSSPAQFSLAPRNGSFSFVLLPRFSLLALAGAIEPLRHANRVLGQQHYSWSVFSEDGAPVLSSSDLPVTPSGSLSDVPLGGNIILVGGADIVSFSSKTMLAWLRRVAVHVPMIGGLCTATRVLAQAGLLDGHRATIHWEMAEGMKEAFPNVEITTRLFEIDHNRITCAGESASIDLVLNLLRYQHGNSVAATVGAQVLHGRMRAAEESQAPIAIRTGTRNKYLLRALDLMEAHQDEVLEIDYISEQAGCSRRHLERLFLAITGFAPVTFYRNLRLDRARKFLCETQLSMVQISTACGFESASAFSNSYKRRFGQSPSCELRSAKLLSGRISNIKPASTVIYSGKSMRC